MNEFKHPIVMAFPLRGEWVLPNTPGTRIPSHGTNAFATRYACDFLQVDWQRRGHPCYRHHVLRYLLLGIPVASCYCYGEMIYAPCDGVVVKIEDDVHERKKMKIISDLRAAKRNSRLDPRKDDAKILTGNMIVVKHREGVYAAFCHLQPGSIQISMGQVIKKGDALGRIGHSGNSMFPHLHFQLMDHLDVSVAEGLPCVFETYEIYEKGRWKNVHNDIPKASDRVRFLESCVSEKI